MQYELYAELTPIAKQSFRYGRRHGYQTARVVVYQQQLYALALAAGWCKLAPQPLCVEIWFRLRCKRRIDLDNLAKGVLDALAPFFQDDWIVDLLLHKRLGEAVDSIFISVRTTEEKNESTAC